MTPSRLGQIALMCAVLVVAALTAMPSRPAAAADTLVVVDEVSLEQFPQVVVAFTVTDAAGLPVADLRRDQVHLWHNGRAVPDLALDRAQADQEGLAVAVAIDTSGSMQGAPLEQARGAVRVLLERMEPRDRVALVAFGQTVQVVHDLTGDRDALSRALDGLVARGDTALYEGAFQAIGLVAGQTLGRRAVVVITDGEDTHSRLSLDDAIARAHQANTSVSVIGFGDVKLDTVQRLASETGGTAGVAPDAEQLAERLAQFAERLRTQYVLRYRAPDSRPPENELELVVDRDGQQGRASRRFPAPPMPPLAISLPDLVPGSTVRGQIELRPAIPDTPRVDRVEYALDGAPLHTATDPPYTFLWDTATVPPGEHTLTVTAHLGEQEAQQSVPLTVGPAVQLRIVLPGAEVVGRVRLGVELDALAPIAEVAWAVDGQPIGTATQPPFEIEWDTSGLPPGPHTVTAMARDARGNLGQASVPVQVLPFGRAVSPSPSPEASPAGVTAPPGGTATPAPTRTATPTPASTGLAGLVDRLSPAVWIGVVVVLAIVGGALAVLARRRGTGVVDATAVPYLPDGAPFGPQAGAPGAPPTAPLALPGGHPAAPTHPGRGVVGPADVREAETEQASVLPLGEAPTTLAPAPASLTVIVPGIPPRSWPLGADQILGRAAGPGVIVVPDPRVSRCHARISWEGGRFVYRDLGPLNPTRRDGRTLPNPYVLRDGDRLTIGRAELVFRA